MIYYLPLQIRGYLESCRNKRDEQGGHLTTEGGELIMEEREYQAITQLKQVQSTTKLCDCTRMDVFINQSLQ